MINMDSSSTIGSSSGQAIIPFSILSSISETVPLKQEDGGFSTATGKYEVLENAESALYLNMSPTPVEQSHSFTTLSEQPSYAMDDPMEWEL